MGVVRFLLNPGSTGNSLIEFIDIILNQQQFPLHIVQSTVVVAVEVIDVFLKSGLQVLLDFFNLPGERPGLYIGLRDVWLCISNRRLELVVFTLVHSQTQHLLLQFCICLLECHQLPQSRLLR